ncbi:type I-C CRISPR-associated protein Cas7/Csd2 [Gordonibacter urolithinfaciens]|uniref:Type I-C CRISPR-associated protein Cas7/Csd2 n=1 Tax=Gordonibacter urolithinfaciens TaxID=1335613 RepID=A0A6N8IGV7_9ACTN|nr:type I-C CRISPR-associated protein Cas7/Csd2 [Gordonibacter urolithinfaciens]MVM54475.1 type I-C CRISPR-associated protein Cas7/Csd2 [Gordonibacter urolithinfaciens]MVN15047.1 type I-C CRISPR-associated protein Cas7/Csd2 [Gordonibacter urolithinfaciens]MVN38555.1 type I-C CRISPR-associated protein Cas7/Csd2 [Gordonibacter urolithinfaciens]MVN55213.1 type I-C CRISPR-associated protein Cas7/Csd2 [Gordonibacter urolithinfaciens]MVN60543.1 type I-C CRISPR-associated protein Cas7/Csd2 [Gordoniba
MAEPIKNRYDFVFFFDVKNGNPNGDPDAGNMPRIDPDTSRGIVSDVCLKRKIRNYVDLVKGEEIDDPDVAEGELGYKIYVQEAAVLNDRNRKAYVHYDMKPASKKLPKAKEDQLKVTKFMCDNFFDIRAFGAVMTTDVNCGQVRGPIQLCFAESVDPVLPLEMSITRMAVTNGKDAEKEKTMGRKQYVPYGLYRAEGFISAALAEKTGFSQEDLDLFFEALMNMFENDRSAARGLMASRKLFAFKHESKLGNAPAHKLFDAVSVKRLIEDGAEARAFSDYEIVVDRAAIPEGVELLELPVE